MSRIKVSVEILDTEINNRNKPERHKNRFTNTTDN